MGDLLGMLALEEAGDAAGELEVFQAAQHFAFGVGKHLAVLAGDGCGELAAVVADQVPHGEEDLAAP